MPTQKLPSSALLRLLLVITFVIQQFLLPLNAAAQAARPAQQLSLLRGSAEGLDAYLQRVAAVQPELFQKAALAAVQDAFNGKLPEVSGEHAMEEQIAFYLHRAATSPGTSFGPPSQTSSSIAKDGTYLWNSSHQDEAGLAGSDWQMTARPGGNSQVFAQNFEAMMAQEMAAAQNPAPLPADADTEQNTLALAELSAQKANTPMSATTALEPAVNAAQNALQEPQSKTVVTLAPLALAPLTATDDVVSVSVAAPDVGLANTSAPAVVAVVPLVVTASAAQIVEADLAVTMTAAITATYGDVVSYTIIVSNAGPSAAAAVQFTQTLPANGTYTQTIPECTAQTDTVVCTIGALGINASKTLTVSVHMKGNEAVTSTVTVADNGGTVDPGPLANSAQAVTTVSTPATRDTREIGEVVIAANEFVTNAGKVEATGAVAIGFKMPDNSISYHLNLAGSEDSVSWQDGADAIEGNGTVAQKLKNIKLFTGLFTIDGSQASPLIAPSPSITPVIKKLGDFAIVGKALISNVTVMTGTALVSATIKLGQPGVVSDTEQSLLATMFPNGSISGDINKFAMMFSGLKVEVSKATFSDDSIKVKQAQLTMPEKLGKLTGVIEDMKLTSNTIDFGGVGVKIPIPDIFPGRSVSSTGAITGTGSPTSTTTTTPTIAIVKNSATVSLSKGKLVVPVEGTLQLRLPGNQRDIPIEIKIDSTGNIEGKVKEIKLSIAGQDLEMKDVVISNDGLKVEEASLTFQSAPDKEKKKDEAGLGTSDTISSTATVSNTTEPKKDKGPDKKLTLIVKNVSINGDGLKIGGAGIKNYLPDVKVGSAATFTKLEFSVTINDPTGNASFELGIKGTLKIHIKDNEQDIPFTAKRDKNGKFSGKLDSLSLTLAKSTLTLSKLAFDEKGISAEEAELKLPEKLNGVKATITKVKIDDNGLSFGDANVTIPIEFTIGNKDEGGNKIAVKGNLKLILAKDRSYGFEVEGTVTISLAKQTAQATGSIRMDSKGEVNGTIESFKLVIAGMELAIKSATIKEGTFEAAEATLSIPKAWGGLSVSVYQIKVSKDNFSIGGGSFKLPEIKVGDMKLTLEGKLQKEGDGYIISAAGTLKMPNVGGAGCSGLGVSVEIFATNTNNTHTVVMKISPLKPGSAEALKLELRKIGVSLECTVPLGASGFDLTQVAGTLTLADNSTKIEIKVTIESKLRVGPFNVLTANGDMNMEYVKNPYKLEMGLGASMKIFSMFEAARARATLRFTDGNQPFLFKAEMNIDAVIAKGEVKLSAWTKDGEFFLTGRIWGKVGVRKGAISDSCWTLRYPNGISWRGITYGEKRVCLSIPPGDLFIEATMEFGKFHKQNGSQWGFKASVSLLGKNYGIFVGTSGGFNVGNTDQFKLIDTPTLQRALLLHQQVASGARAPSSLNQVDMGLLKDYHFNGPQVAIDVANLTQPSDLGVTIILAEPDADVQIELRRPDGLQFSSGNAPGNVTFREEYVPAGSITDPTTGQPIAAPPILQRIMNVTKAELGQWQIVLNRQPTHQFIVNVDGTKYGPPVEKLALQNLNHTNNTVDLSWSHSAVSNTLVSIYASQGQITTTAGYTELVATSSGLASSQVVTVDLGTVTQFGGTPVTQFTYPAGAQAPTETVNLSFLQSGIYNLWLEVDDGLNPPTRKYFPGTIAVEHPWADTWQGNVVAQPLLGGLTVAWSPHANSDADGYEVRVTAQGGDLYDEDVYTIDAGENLSQTITGLTTNQPYTVTVIAYDTGSGHTSNSEGVQATPLSAPFTFVASPAAVTVRGGTSANVGFTIASALAAYPGQVFLDLDALPEGIDAEFNTDAVTPTLLGAQANLVVTPTASLLGGIYTLTVAAAADGDTKRIAIPIAVQAPDYALQANRIITIPMGSSASLGIGAVYQFGETDAIKLDVEDMPEGITWEFTQPNIVNGQQSTQSTLVLTSTEYATPGTYAVFIKGTDFDHAHSLPLSVTVTGFEVSSPWDSYAAAIGATVTYPVHLDGAAWSAPVTLSIDPDSLGIHFAAQAPAAPSSVPADVGIGIRARADTPPGIYELLLQASSGGITQTIPLYLTIQESDNATDLQMISTAGATNGIADNSVIAGETYTYVLKARNISNHPAQGVVITDTTLDTSHLTLVASAGCTLQTQATETDLGCAVGNVATYTETAGIAIAWRVAPDAPDGMTVLHIAEVAASPGSVTETSLIDNEAEQELTVQRLSDVQVTVVSGLAVAGASFTLSATVRNEGPSASDEVVADWYLPEGVALVSASPGCAEDAELITCNVGDLASGTQKVITTTLHIESDLRKTLGTLISVEGESDDPNLANNAAVVATAVAAISQLALQITGDATQANEGDAVNFTVVVTNQGPSQATNMALSLTVPPNADVVSVAVGDATSPLSGFTLEAGEVLTVNVALLFAEDSKTQPIRLGVTAQATESAMVQASSPALILLNVQPTALLSDTFTVNEGEWGVLNVHMADVGTTHDPLTAKWDLNNDGVYDDDAGAITLFDARTIDGPATRPIAVQITDDEGGVTIVTGTVTILNVAPTVEIGEDQNHVYNQPFVLGVLTNDLGPGDASSYQLTVNWGDGAVETKTQTSLSQPTAQQQLIHTYSQLGKYTANVCLDDKEGGVQCDQAVLQATCQQHGLIMQITNTTTQANITLENTSGNLAIPAGLPITLYAGSRVLKTFVLDQPIGLSQSRTLQVALPSTLNASLVQAVLDDDGTGKKVTQLCSGSVSKSLNLSKVYLSVMNKAR